MRLTSILAPWLAATSLAVQASPTARSVSAGGFPSADGLMFSIDGVTKYYAGTNSYWISFLTNNADVETVMSHVAQSGLKIFRVWGFNDVGSSGSGVWFQMLSASGSTINTGANGLQRLDAVVASAEKHGVKLIIPFVNFWDDYGGMSMYVRAFGGTKATWYTNTRAQQQYRAYIQAVVNRYKNSNAIFAWELANEPRCQGCSTDVIYNWASSASAYVKSLDPNHMVTLGDEGMGISGGTTYPFQFSEGTDFAKNLKISTLDFGTFHMYPQSWGVDSTSFPTAWIKAHGDACAAAGKPCLYEEYGTSSNHCGVEQPWQQVSRSTKGLAGDLFWQWGDQISSGQTHNDGNTIYYGTSDFTCLVTNHVKAIG